MNPYSVVSTPFTIAQELAQRHKRLRKHLGLSQLELAERADVSLGSLKRFEQHGKISLDNLLKLANVLDRLVDFDQIFLFDQEKAAAEAFFRKTMAK